LQLEAAGKKSRITGFNDPTIADSMAVIDLVDAIKKGSVNYANVKSGLTHQVISLMTANVKASDRRQQKMTLRITVSSVVFLRHFNGTFSQ
jgi:hypothetical protein